MTSCIALELSITAGMKRITGKGPVILAYDHRFVAITFCTNKELVSLLCAFTVLDNTN